MNRFLTSLVNAPGRCLALLSPPLILLTAVAPDLFNGLHERRAPLYLIVLVAYVLSRAGYRAASLARVRSTRDPASAHDATSWLLGTAFCILAGAIFYLVAIRCPGAQSLDQTLTSPRFWAASMALGILEVRISTLHDEACPED